MAKQRWRKIAIALSIAILLSVLFPDVRRFLASLRHFRAANSSPVTLDNIPNNDGGHFQYAECPPPPTTFSGPHFHRPAGGLGLNIPHVDQIPVCRPRTPLFIAFGAKQCLLEQTLLSLRVEGWPASQIVIFDNSGVSAKNAERSSQPDHISSLNYTLLLDHYRVAIYRLPIRLNFAQLQNFWIDLATQSNITDFYWAHQDIVVRSYIEDPAGKLFYHHILDEQNQLASKDPSKWAFGFYRYDLLSHVNVRVMGQIGAWDDRIPYYPTDCDYYSRTRHHGLVIFDHQAGDIYDVASCLPDINSLLLSPTTAHYTRVTKELEKLEKAKMNSKNKRYSWQGSSKAYDNLIDASRQNYYLKWHTNACDARPITISGG